MWFPIIPYIGWGGWGIAFGFSGLVWGGLCWAAGYCF